LSYASNFPRKNRAARGFAHGLSGKISTRTFKNIAQMPLGIQRRAGGNPVAFSLCGALQFRANLRLPRGPVRAQLQGAQPQACSARPLFRSPQYRKPSHGQPTCGSRAIRW